MPMTYHRQISDHESRVRRPRDMGSDLVSDYGLQRRPSRKGGLTQDQGYHPRQHPLKRRRQNLTNPNILISKTLPASHIPIVPAMPTPSTPSGRPSGKKDNPGHDKR